MENDPLLTPPPPKIWNFPYVLSLFFLKASLKNIQYIAVARSNKKYHFVTCMKWPGNKLNCYASKKVMYIWGLTILGHLVFLLDPHLPCEFLFFLKSSFYCIHENREIGIKLSFILSILKKVMMTDRHWQL